ncbi:MAG: nuclear transport factor 2 family protein [Halobacteriaceae archaeon]
MSVEIAQRYFEVSDDPDKGVEDIVALFSDDATLKSPREGIFHGKSGVREFFQLNEEFFAAGQHNMTDFYTDGATVICEGTIEGKTTAGREYEGIGLVDIMEFNEDDEISALRVYLDYSGILTELPEEVPSYT